MTGPPAAKRTTLPSVTDLGKSILVVEEKGWFGLLNRDLVGKVGVVGNKGVGFSAMTEWVGR